MQVRWIFLFLFLCLSFLLLFYFSIGIGLESHLSRRRQHDLRHVLALCTGQLNTGSSMIRNGYFLDFGTLLGHVRDRDIIDKDIDVDIGLVVIRSDQSAIEHELQSLLSIEFDIIITPDSMKCYWKRNANMSVDLIYYRPNQRDGHQWLSHMDLVSDRADDVFPTRKVPFGLRYETIHVCVPKHPEVLLQNRYGHSWRVPISNDKGIDGGRSSKLKDLSLRSAMTWRDLLNIKKSME